MRPVEQFLFCHVPKTAGTSFRQMLNGVFAAEDIYPNEAEIAANGGYLRLPDLDRAKVRNCRLLVGHLPTAARVLFDKKPNTMVILREPVSRALSNLRHIQRTLYRDLNLEAIIDMPSELRQAASDRQTTLLSFRSIPDVMISRRIKPDRARLEIAKQTLVECPFVGLTERFQESIDLCERTFGWKFPDRNVVTNVSPLQDEDLEHILPRIQGEVQLDIELYDFARRLFAERLAAALAGPSSRLSA